MKKIILTGREIALLLKVSNSGWKLCSQTKEFLENNSELAEDESAEYVVSKNSDYLTDIINKIRLYLTDDSLSGEDYPSEKERMELKELFLKLNEI